MPEDLNLPLLNNQIANMQENFTEHKKETKEQFVEIKKQNEDILKKIEEGFKWLSAVYTTRPEHLEVLKRLENIESVKDAVVKWFVYAAIAWLLAFVWISKYIN